MESKDIHNQYPPSMPVLPNLPHLSIPSAHQQMPNATEYSYDQMQPGTYINKDHYKDITIPTHINNINNPYQYPSPRISPQFNLNHGSHPPPLPPLNSQFLPLSNIPAPMTSMTYSQDPHHTHFSQISPMPSPRSMSMPSIPINHPMSIPPHTHSQFNHHTMSAFKYPTTTCSNVQIYDINPNPSQSTVDIMSESASTNSSNYSNNHNEDNPDIPMLPIPPPSMTSNAFYPSEYPENVTDHNHGPNPTDHTLFDDITPKIKEDTDASFIPPITMDASSFSDFDDDRDFIDQKPQLLDLPTDSTTNSSNNPSPFDVTRTICKPVKSRRKKINIKPDTEGITQNNDDYEDTPKQTKKTRKRAKKKCKSTSKSSSTSSNGTKKKIHICPAPNCTKEFKYKSHLERHMASHSKSKPFKCPTCKKSFGHQYYLQDHIRYNHIKDGAKDRKHICSICNKTFRLKINLTNHYRIHTGEKPFKCKNCNKAFTQKGNCDAHYRACIGIKPFECKTCNKTFTRKMYLQQHERTHTGIKPFKCNICDKAFAIKSNMVKHKRARHKNEV